MLYENVTCPHCGLLCDDLSIESDGQYEFKITSELPPSCRAAMESSKVSSDHDLKATVAGQSVSTEDAIHKAAKIIAKARQPLVSGLIGDVAAARSAVELADRINGIIDHADSDGLMCNVAAMQRYGTVATTLAEVRNRAECIVVFGNGVFKHFPRLLERIFLADHTLSENLNRRIYVLDIEGSTQEPVLSHESVEYVSLPVESLENAIQLVNYALSRERDFRITRLESGTEALTTIVTAIQQSAYTVFAWSTSEFSPESAEMTVQSLNACIKQLSERLRCVGLPLGGSKGQITANQVCTWQTGVPLRTQFIGHAPQHNQTLYSAHKLLSQNEVDVLIWIAAFHPDDLPPQSQARTIVLGHPNMQFDSPVDVFIPVSIPGIDSAGLACRTDSVATLPLRKIRDIGLPQASTVITDILHALQRI